MSGRGSPLATGRVRCQVCGRALKAAAVGVRADFPLGFVPLHGYKQRGSTNSNGCFGSGWGASATREDLAAACDRMATSELVAANNPDRDPKARERDRKLAAYWSESAKGLRRWSVDEVPMTIKKYPGMGGLY